MTNYVNDLDKTKPTEFDPVADGAGEIRGIKEALRNTFPNANTPLTVSNESIVEAVEAVNSGEVGGGNANKLCSVKWNGKEIKYEYNVASVTENSAGSLRVTFKQPINLDGDLSSGDYVVVLTCVAINGRMMVGSLQDQRELYVDIAFREEVDPNQYWGKPVSDQSPFPQKTYVGFQLIVLDQIPEPA